MAVGWESTLDGVPVRWQWNRDPEGGWWWLWVEVDGLIVQYPWEVVYMRPKDCRKRQRKTGQAIERGWWLADGDAIRDVDGEKPTGPLDALLWSVAVEKLEELRKEDGRLSA